MKNRGLFRLGVALTIIILAAATVVVYSTSNKNKQPLLPYYGPEGDNGEPHYVSDFHLIDQDSNAVDGSMYKNKIYVADFFFTTCRGICPLMSEQMLRAYKKYYDDPDVLFLSHTVDPEEDTPCVLKRYAEHRDINTAKWHFVTGDKKQIYDLARYSYLVDASTGDGGPTDFVHTDNFALVDRNGRIRGYYDGTDSVQVNKLIGDIALLEKEK